MKRTAADRIAEAFLCVVVVAFLSGYGWLILLNEGITLVGKGGSSVYLAASDSVWYATATFITAAGFFLFMAKSVGVRNSTSLAICGIIALQPVFYFVTKFS